MQNFGMWGMYNLAKAYRSIKKSIANRRVEDLEASNGHTKYRTRLFHGPWHDPVGEHISAQPFRMWSTLRFHPFLQVSQIFQRRKSDANKQDFENTLNLTCQAQSTPKTMRILTKVFCSSGLIFVVLAWTGDELSHGQAQNLVNFDFEAKFDIEGQSQPPPHPHPGPTTTTTTTTTPKNSRDFTQGLLHLWSKFGDPSFNWCWVIAWTNLVTDGRTDGRTQAMTIPVGQNLPRVKKPLENPVLN